ncbi:MAG TPA: TIGR02206 family membrane protein [Thermoanaerobaculia bacterium]|nr:TIGR02206 family membrane protein [Thermoanaerobaculia bacterium]
MERFHLYSAAHLLALLGITAATAILIALGRRWRRDDGPSLLEKVLGGGTLAIWLVINGWWLWPSRFNVRHSLPLQMCDLALAAVPVVLLTRWRPARAILYFWGLALSTQGLITPDLTDGPSTLSFWFFWLYHAAVVGTAAYDLAVHRFRPDWRDYGLAVAAGLAYVAILFPLDIALRANYGYLGNRRPAQPTLLDFLGPWPGRVVIIILLAAGVMALLEVPWALARRRRAAVNA